MKKAILYVLLVLLGSYIPSASAEVRPMVITGLFFGGDTLVSTTAGDLDAGGLLYIGGGILIEPENTNMAFQTTLGYKWDTIDFDVPSGDSTISSNPLEFIAYFKSDNVRLGAGIAYHMNPEWEFCVEGSGCAVANFDNATGFIIDGVFQSVSTFSFGVRFTSIDYKTPGLTVNANSIGLTAGFYF